MHIQINAQTAANSLKHSSYFSCGCRLQNKERLLKFILRQETSNTHSAALPDPVAQPPVTEGYASCGGEEEEDVDDECC